MADLDQEIFEAGAEPAAAPAPSDDATVVRDSIRALQREGGRDSPTAPREPREPGPQAPPAQHGVEDQSPAGLLKAMLDERDRRQGLERQLRQYQDQERDNQRRAQENETPFDQRFFSQPQQELDSFVTARLTPIEQRMQNFMTDVDMRMTRAVHGEAFDQAFQTWFEQVGDPSRPDPQSYFAVMNSPSPGASLMAWFEDATTRREIGNGGLQAYRDRVRAEILAEYGIAAPPNGGGQPIAPPQQRPRDEETGQFTPRHEVRLPTSLSRLGSAGRGTPAPAEDGSEEAIFDAGRPERRR